MDSTARHGDGDWRWVETSSGVYRAGDAERIVLNSRDVTERMQLAETLRRTQDDLELRVKERTSELHTAIGSLEEEIKERQRAERNCGKGFPAARVRSRRWKWWLFPLRRNQAGEQAAALVEVLD